MSAELKQAVDMVNIEVDGIALQAPKGSMIIEATDKVGIEIPRFCYHPKLSISASCRMCLVDVEKMPKPVPACATPVMEGMKVYTDSRRAMDAQHGVMEFLLINHPLDCPICDQGGECDLQDQAMGYGRSVSRFTERKRVVKDKNVGPLVQTEMTRCIHCTRCVRFLEEIAGTTEMGGSGRGDRLEIGTCVENSIDSELSGNIIDLCPVGALTNKPFRFAARAWELVARPSIAMHDGVGSHLFHHVRRGQVLRSVPRANEATNETWLSDRDRFSEQGLNADDRVLMPQLKENGEWKQISWDEAVESVTGMLRAGIEEHGPEQVGFLMSPSATTEEYFLAQSMARQLGCKNIDHRMREHDMSDDQAQGLVPAFTRKIAEIDNCDVVLLAGCNPQAEAPIIGHRVRQAWRNGAEISVINPLDWSFVFKTSLDAVVAPQYMVGELAALAAAVEKVTGKAAPDPIRSAMKDAPVNERHEALATRLKDADSGLVLLGQLAMSHPDAAWLRALAAYISDATACAFNVLPHGSNGKGAWLAGAVPHRGPGGTEVEAGFNADQMLASPRKCYVLFGLEPGFDIDNPARALGALRGAEKLIVISSFALKGLRKMADIILPLAPYAESEGSMVNLDGDTYSFAAAARPGGEARPGWKILRKLGGELGLQGFSQVDLADVQAGMAAAFEQAGVTPGMPELTAPVQTQGLYRIGEVPMYSVDGLCRRSEPLQKTVQAQSDFLGLNAEDAKALGLSEGDKARVRQGEGQSEFKVEISGSVPPGGVWLRSACCETHMLEHAIAPISVEVA